MDIMKITGQKCNNNAIKCVCVFNSGWRGCGRGGAGVVARRALVRENS